MVAVVVTVRNGGDIGDGGSSGSCDNDVGE